LRSWVHTKRQPFLRGPSDDGRRHHRFKPIEARIAEALRFGVGEPLESIGAGLRRIGGPIRGALGSVGAGLFEVRDLVGK
jgi:hypothetical protein